MERDKLRHAVEVVDFAAIELILRGVEGGGGELNPLDPLVAEAKLMYYRECFRRKRQEQQLDRTEQSLSTGAPPKTTSRGILKGDPTVATTTLLQPSATPSSTTRKMGEASAIILTPVVSPIPPQHRQEVKNFFLFDKERVVERLLPPTQLSPEAWRHKLTATVDAEGKGRAAIAVQQRREMHEILQNAILQVKRIAIEGEKRQMEGLLREEAEERAALLAQESAVMQEAVTAFGQFFMLAVAQNALLVEEEGFRHLHIGREEEEWSKFRYRAVQTISHQAQEEHTTRQLHRALVQSQLLERKLTAENLAITSDAHRLPSECKVQ